MFKSISTFNLWFNKDKLPVTIEAKQQEAICTSGGMQILSNEFYAHELRGFLVQLLVEMNELKTSRYLAEILSVDKPNFDQWAQGCVYENLIQCK